MCCSEFQHRSADHEAWDRQACCQHKTLTVSNGNDVATNDSFASMQLSAASETVGVCDVTQYHSDALDYEIAINYKYKLAYLSIYKNAFRTIRSVPYFLLIRAMLHRDM